MVHDRLQIPIAKIRQQLTTMHAGKTWDRSFIEQLEVDSRESVRKLAATFKKRMDKQEQEYARISGMIQFDQSYRESHGSHVAGIDEAGRGCLAGPVVAAAVILPVGIYIDGLNDSKQMSPLLRESVYDEILAHAVSYGIGIVSADDIDAYNILQATYEAMRQAIGQLSVVPDVLLNDAVQIPEVSIQQISILQGDAKSFSIAAASVLAKVTRDRLMREYSIQYPEYGFSKHVGYGTSEHIAALRTYGPCPIHRLTFAKVTE
ncbi:ribonuclease HII [Fodinisporobacter ferrooxydans]|uniref:Ribonuclease HII n=1 Tax=Fodinisporobacter ferrooxydans TaxID=2901836 RepID=A0ABY4CFP5_9BACL|nr:ribonuclease HII [Alicyclobacillaceae bacterium MYW30-H2]